MFLAKPIPIKPKTTGPKPAEKSVEQAKPKAKPSKTSHGKVRSESVEQIILIARIRQFHPQTIVYAIPNGGKRSPREAAKLKKEGVLPGIPDLCVAEPKGPWHGLYIEMKKTIGGSVSIEQTRIQAALRQRGYKSEVCEGVEAAYSVFLDYMGIAHTGMRKGT